MVIVNRDRTFQIDRRLANVGKMFKSCGLNHFQFLSSTHLPHHAHRRHGTNGHPDQKRCHAQVPTGRRLSRMQIIFEFSGSPEQYVAWAAHKKVRPPPCCPTCGAQNRFEALDYYTRGISRKDSSGVMPFSVRRFRCVVCGASVSLLPNFAQPYRLVRNETVQNFFDGQRDVDDVLRWDYLLRRYLRRFCQWFPELVVRTAVNPNRSPPGNVFEGFWETFKKLWGSLPLATGQLVSGFQVTAFGAYKCHAVPLN